MKFSEFQDLALYSPQGGFYTSNGQAGRGGDFITSPEVGTLFGFVIAAALDRWWRALRRPDPFYVVEAGAGTGTLAAAIAEAEPDCLPALRYVMVERSLAIRSEQIGRLPLQPEADLYEVAKRGSGPRWYSMAEMPKKAFTGVILANELLDNLSVDLVEFHDHHWNHVCIGLSRTGDIEEILVPIEDDEPIGRAARHFGRGATDGARLALQGQAQDWVQSSLALLERGRLVVFDYGTDSRSMLTRPMDEWLRTYRNHRPGSEPLDLPGSQDITCDVAIDQLADVRPLTHDRSQAEFLDAHGLRTFISDAREVWHGRADIGDLAALRARGRVQESHALTDLDGLGAHRVLEWVVDPTAPATSTTEE